MKKLFNLDNEVVLKFIIYNNYKLTINRIKNDDERKNRKKDFTLFFYFYYTSLTVKSCAEPS